MNRNNVWVQTLLVLIGIFFTVLGLSYALKLPWIDSVHLWNDGPLTKVWYGSVFLGIGPLLIWMAWAKEWGLVPGLGCGIIVMLIGVAGSVFNVYLQTRAPAQLAVVLTSLVLAGLSLWLAAWSWKFPIRDDRVTPLTFRIITVVLLLPILLFCVRLLMRHPTVFPWKLSAESSPVMGWMFLGALISFAVALVRPRWLYMRTLFLWFVVYDLVLIPYYIPHFKKVLPEHRMSLNIYFAVLIASLVASGYYFFLAPGTRFGAAATRDPAA